MQMTLNITKFQRIHLKAYQNYMMNLLKSGGSIPLPDDEHLLDELKSHLDELHDMGFDINDYNEVVLKDRDDTDGFVS